MAKSLKSLVAKEEEKASDIQAVLCPKEKYPEAEKAAAWVEEQGLDGSDMEDEGEHWAFIQFESSLCKEGTANRETTEEGCIAVFCVREGEEEEEEEKTSRVAGGEGETSGKAIDKAKNKTHQCGCKGADSVSAKSEVKAALEAVNKAVASLAAAKKSAEADKPEDKPEETKKTLPGIAFAKALKACLDEHAPLQEDKSVQRAAKKTYKIWSKTTSSAYPGEDFGWPKAEDDPEDDDKDDEEDEPDEEEVKALQEAIAKLALATEQGRKNLYALTGK